MYSCKFYVGSIHGVKALSMMNMLMSIVIMRMMQGNPCKDLSFSLAQIKERKETST